MWFEINHRRPSGENQHTRIAREIVIQSLPGASPRTLLTVRCPMPSHTPGRGSEKAGPWSRVWPFHPSTAWRSRQSAFTAFFSPLFCLLPSQTQILLYALPIFVILIQSLQNFPIPIEPCDLLYSEGQRQVQKFQKHPFNMYISIQPQSSLYCAATPLVKGSLSLSEIYPTEF